jgi:polysaccharide export outer membrane protein
MNMTNKWAWSVLIIVALVWGFAGSQENPEAGRQTQGSNVVPNSSGTHRTPTPDSNFEERNRRYKLGAGDSFEVSFELSPEFNQTATVQPDGFVTLRGIGDLQVAGRTMPDLTELLRHAYSKILHEPLINVVLKDFEKPYFVADGQVGHPGKYDLRGDTTLTQAIAMSGGFLDSAKHSQVLLFRRVSDGWFSAQIFDVKKMQKNGDLHEDPYLRPGDMLFVPKNRFSKIKPLLPGYSLGTTLQPH